LHVPLSRINLHLAPARIRLIDEIKPIRPVVAEIKLLECASRVGGVQEAVDGPAAVGREERVVKPGACVRSVEPNAAEVGGWGGVRGGGGFEAG